MQNFREYYEMGTDEYAKHTKKMTPGQDVKEATYRVEIEGEGVATVQARTEKEAEAKAFRKLGLKTMRKIRTLKPKAKITKESLEEGPGKNKGETWEQGYKRRVVKTTKPEHKEKGYKWRIKGKERPEISIKLYREKPSQAEYNKQMRRVAGHEFGG